MPRLRAIFYLDLLPTREVLASGVADAPEEQQHEQDDEQDPQPSCHGPYLRLSTFTVIAASKYPALYATNRDA